MVFSPPSRLYAAYTEPGEQARGYINGKLYALLDDGQIVEAGPPEELFDHPKQKRTQDFLNKVL